MMWLNEVLQILKYNKFFELHVYVILTMLLQDTTVEVGQVTNISN